MNITVWKSWFIVELYKEIPPLLLVFKILETCFFYFRPFFNFQKSFILYQLKHSSHNYLAKNGGAIVTPAPTVS